MTLKSKDFTRNQQYWGTQYYEYWKALTAEAERSSVQYDDGVNKTPGWTFYRNLIDRLNIEVGHSTLEAGCGFGRSIDYLSTISGRVSCIDISPQMIQEAIRAHGHRKNLDFTVGPIEETPYKSASFDKIVCYGVFEAAFQEFALIEMRRLLKVNGEVLLTGKNYFYMDDDLEAKTAEVNAYENGHPNFFTHYPKMVEFAASIGLEKKEEIFFLRRSDMVTGQFQTKMPEKFYYYATIFVKNKSSELSTMYPDPPRISSPRSALFATPSNE